MRVLCTTSPAYGHFHPMVPLARALVDGGHDVAFATAQDFCSRVEQAGFVAFPSGIGMTERGVGRVIEEMSALPLGERQKFGFRRIFAETGAPAMLTDLVGLVRSYKPDLLIHDASELTGPIAATMADIPHVSHSYGHLTAIDVVLDAAEALAPLWRQSGHEPPNAAGIYRHMYLDICPPSLQFPHIQDLPVAQKLRPVSFDAAHGEKLPPWIEDLSDDPIVYVTFGTVFNGGTPIFQQILDGLSDQPLNLIMTLGQGGDPASFGPQPANVRIERYIPQTLLFPRCKVVVSHGGSGTMLAALGHGLPLLMIPQGADQFRNAERCAAAGAAKALDGRSVSADIIRREVLALLEDVSYRTNAERLREEIERMPSPAKVVPILEKLARVGSALARDS